ncbi:MAG: hypothetical protein WEA58_10950 [Balneolaceae bacterium]
MTKSFFFLVFLFLPISGFSQVVTKSSEVHVSEVKTQNSDHVKKSGYFNRTGFDILRADDTTVRFYMVNGYRFTPQFSVGAGIGITPYNDPLTLIPFFIDFNLQLLEANTSPYIFLKTGYNFSLHHDEDAGIDDHTGGLLFNPGAGIQFNLRKGFGWYINAGYNIDNSYFEFDTWGPQTVENDLSFRRVNVGLGLSF